MQFERLSTQNHNRSFTFPLVLLAVTVAVLQGCSGGGSSNSSQKNNGTSYLTVSHEDLYFGTRDVGSETTQSIILTNQSADTYPINVIEVSGTHTNEFTLDYDSGAMTLEPGNELQLALSFLPLSSGAKQSSLKIDHDIVVKASDKENQLEQRYYQARKLERSQRYSESLDEYQGYIAGKPTTENKRRANVKVPVLTEDGNHDESKSTRLYTAALDLREKSNSDAAIQSLDTLLENDSQSYLADDALYLKGYIYLIDNKDYEQAYNAMLELRFTFPESSYYDTALYVEAIAQQELGFKELAHNLFSELRARHTGISLDLFNIEWPKDNYISRLWFDRSTQAIESLKPGARSLS